MNDQWCKMNEEEMKMGGLYILGILREKSEQDSSGLFLLRQHGVFGCTNITHLTLGVFGN